jgi:hypothetical protein
MTHECPQPIITVAAPRPAAGRALTPIGRAGVKPVALYNMALLSMEKKPTSAPGAKVAISPRFL